MPMVDAEVAQWTDSRGHFDWCGYLASFDERLLSDPRGRRILTRFRPLLFALLYFRDHLASDETNGEISFNQFHLDLIAWAQSWVRDGIGPAEERHAWIAPRGCGKSSWIFLMLPAWALAHRHRRFIAAFSDSAHQAQQHLSSFKRELDGNELLRLDHPALCTPAKRAGGASVADNTSLYVADSGVVFQAKGIDSSTLGAKVGAQRPDLLLFDDVEPDASNYSAFQKDKRLATITSAVLPMNLNAVVCIVGTTTMHGSVMHDLMRGAVEAQPPAWVADEGFQVHYYPAIVATDGGDEASLWPQRWSLEYLQSIRHTRAFAMNFMNAPVSVDGAYWSPEDFRYDVPPAPTRKILSVDPAVTAKNTSDFTGLAVVSYDPSERRCLVERVTAVKLAPAQLRAKILSILEADPAIRMVLMEVNQGQDAWAAILKPLPVKMATIHQSIPKNVRAAKVLDYYQSGWVAHLSREACRAFEEQALSFPNVANDDCVDAVCTGVSYFLRNRKAAPRRPEAVAYA